MAGSGYYTITSEFARVFIPYLKQTGFTAELTYRSQRSSAVAANDGPLLNLAVLLVATI